MNQIRLLTYNVQNGKRIDRIIDWLNRLPDTDVICLQEFPKDKIQECMLLLGRISYGFAFADAFTYRKRTFGELTLYRKDRLKNVRSRSISLGINSMEKRILKTTVPRSLLVLHGNINKKTITIVNVHMVALALNTVKFSQVEQLMNSMKKVVSPVILLGDFNISSLLGKKKLLRLLSDNGYMVHPKKIATHHVGLIKHQFDYICSKKCTILDQKAERVRFSDHYPILSVCEI